MPYCPKCGTEVSENDNHCRKCGKNLNSSVRGNPINKGKDVIDGARNWYSRRHNTIEFIVALVALVFALLTIPQAFSSYSFSSESVNIMLFILLVIIIAVLATFLTRYYARTGSIILLISLLILTVLGIENLFTSIFVSIIAVAVSFVLNKFKN